MLQYIKNTKHYLSNINNWLKVLWDDFDWDYYFLFEILRKKLLNMATHFIKFGNSDDRYEVATQMLTCVYLIEMIQEDNFCDREWEEYWEKYPFTGWDNNNYSEEQSTTIFSISSKEMFIKQEVINQLFKIISENIQTWWD
jgi:hypothetical protein